MIEVDAGAKHSLALRRDGTVVAWGRTVEGQSSVPPDLTNVVAISAGGFHNLALRRDGTVVAWGDNIASQSEVPSGLSNVVAISAGRYFSCALQAGGNLVSWGSADYGERTPPQDLNAVPVHSAGQVDSSTPGTYVLTYSATNGLGGINIRTRTVVVPSPPAVAVSGGPSAQSNRVATLNGWVNPNSQQTAAWFEWGIARGNLTNRIAAGEVGSGAEFVSVNATVENLIPGLVYHARAAASNASGIVYGRDVKFGSPALAMPGGSEIHVRGGTPFVDPGATAWGAPVSIAAGEEHNLVARQDGTVAGAGNNDFGQATAPEGLSNVVSLAAGKFMSIAVTASGEVVEWGTRFADFRHLNWWGSGGVVEVFAGDFYAIALQHSGEVLPWGDYSSRQIPNPFSIARAVAAGSIHSLLLNPDGSVSGFGYNEDGQTTPPDGLTGVKALAAGITHSLALLADGSVVGWGNGSYGNSGGPSVTNVVAIASGLFHNLALRSDGTVVAWGANGSGQINVPEGLSNVVAIAAKGYHSLAQLADGRVIGWGSWSSVPANITNLVVTTNSTVNTAVPGVYSVTYSITNVLGGVNQQVRTVVVDDPGAITFEWDTPARVTAGVPFAFTLTAKGLAGQTVADYPGTVRFTSADGAALLPVDALLTNGTGTFTATLGTPGDWTLIAEDATNLILVSTSAVIIVEADFTNQPPVVGVALQNVTATLGAEFTWTFPTNAFVEPDGHEMNYTALGLPDGLSLTSASRTVSGTPAELGVFTVLVIAGDGYGPELYATNSFTLSVTRGTNTAGGDYAGLFYNTNTLSHESSGAFRFTVAQNSRYSGTIEFGGRSLRLAGTLDALGRATNQLPWQKTNTLTFEWALDNELPPASVAGRVTGPGWTAVSYGTARRFQGLANPAPYAGRYTFVLPGIDGDPALPEGDGYASISINTRGDLKFSGSLADGTKLTDSGVVGATGLWPFYASLYRGGGSIFGWMEFTDGPDYNVSGTVAWTRSAQPKSRHYPAGFSIDLPAVGSAYTPPATGESLLDFMPGELILLGGNLAVPVTNGVSFNASGKLVVAGTNGVVVTVNPALGLIKGTFRHPLTGRTTPFGGAVVQSSNQASGYFLGTNTSGRIILR